MSYTISVTGGYPVELVGDAGGYALWLLALSLGGGWSITGSVAGYSANWRHLQVRLCSRSMLQDMLRAEAVCARRSQSL